jgi:hypothetical protein
MAALLPGRTFWTFLREFASMRCKGDCADVGKEAGHCSRRLPDSSTTWVDSGGLR